MKKLKFLLSLAVSVIIGAALFTSGCGDDSGVVNNNTAGYHPNLVFTTGQTLVLSNDSLHETGGGHTWTGVRTTDVIQAQTTFPPTGGRLCNPVISTNFDSSTSQTATIPYYISYDQSTGKYYQYGIGNLINPTQTPTWDVVGDFDVQRGNQYGITTINYTVNLGPPFGSVTFTGPLNGRIADSTSIVQSSNGQSIACYRIELNAVITGIVAAQTITASIFIDYYLGYASPTGLVELKLRPFSFMIGATPVLNEPGFDRRLYSHTP